MKLPRFFVILLAFALALPLRAQPPIRLAAAADLEPVLPPILKQFRQKTGIEVVPSFHASAMLTTQLQNGAPFDVFLSADLGYPQRLINSGIGEGTPEGKPITYAKGTLVLWARKDSPLPPPSLDLLSNPKLRHLAIANPDRAPYGRAAVAALKKLNLYDSLKPKLAMAENIAQAAQFADSANADAGLISLTSAMTPTMTSNGTWFVIPRDLYPPIEQGAVIVRSTKHRAEAHKLIDYLLSAPVQAEFAKSGLTPVH